MNAPRSAWAERVLAVFALDVRSLALMRALLALLLLGEGFHSLAEVARLYGDGGVLPRASLTLLQAPWAWSLHLINGTTAFALLLLLAQIGAALALLLGWRSRAALALCWLLLTSLHARNPLILTDGDVFLTSLLFWGLFLPLGARWSVDAALGAPRMPLDTWRGWSAAALLLQLLSVFVLAGFGRPGPNAGATLLAALEGLPTLPPALSLLPLLALSPVATGPVRAAVVLCLLLLELPALANGVGVGPWAVVAGLGALIPSWVWDHLGARRARAHPVGTLRIFHEADAPDSERLARLLREFLLLPQATTLQSAAEQARARRLAEANASWVVIDHDDTAHLKWEALLVLLRRSPLAFWLAPLLAGPVCAARGQAWLEALGRRRLVRHATLPLRRVRHAPGPRWQALAALAGLLMAVCAAASLQLLPPAVGGAFSPPLVLLGLSPPAPLPPLPEPGWFVAPGRLAAGGEVDVLAPETAAPDYSPARREAAQARNGARWRAWRAQMALPGAAAQRADWAAWLCRDWNAHRAPEAPERLTELRLVYLSPVSGRPESGYEQRLLLRRACADAAPR